MGPSLASASYYRYRDRYRYKKKQIFQRFRSRPDSDIPRSGQPKLNIPPEAENFCTFARMQAARLPVVSPSHNNHAPTRQHTTVAKQVSPVPAPLAPSLARPSRSAPSHFSCDVEGWRGVQPTDTSQTSINDVNSKKIRYIMSCARTRAKFFWVWSPQIQIFQAAVTPQSRYSRGWSNIR